MKRLTIPDRAYFEIDCEGDLEIQILDGDDYTYLNLTEMKRLRDYLISAIEQMEED